MNITLKKTDSDDPDFQSLVVLLDRELKIRDGEDHDFYHQFNKTTGLREVIVAYYGETPVGCGAFKSWDETTAEVKRMFVQPDYRGKGIAHQVLSALEAWAASVGFKNCVLETGKNQPEAIALYGKAGYHLIPNYGQYAGIDNSVCMKKAIVGGKN